MKKRKIKLSDIERILVILLAHMSIIKEHRKKEVRK